MCFAGYKINGESNNPDLTTSMYKYTKTHKTNNC